MSDNRPTCFVIMPFGEKTDVEGRTVDFDHIYEHIIAGAIRKAGLEAKRSIDEEESGFIHRKMIEHIRDAPVAVVDLSLLNANVFYELGVRHTLREFVTVLIRRRGTSIPFNIQGLNIIEYDESSKKNVAQAKKKITSFIINGQRSRKNDSLVHEVIDIDIRNPSKPLTRLEEYPYRFADTERAICLLTGDIRNIRGAKAVDIWVNSENTNMQMARYYDWSISSVIRYLGARRDAKNKIVQDVISDELMAIMDGDNYVDPGTVIATGSGELENSHGVKVVFHVAAVVGEIGYGYKPIDNLPVCVTNALSRVDSEYRDRGFKSILFPLLGAGVGKGDLSENVLALFEAVVAYLHAKEDTVLERICFVVWSDEELKTCQAVLESFQELSTPEGPA